MVRVSADRDVCIGAGMCVMTADEVFDQDESEGLVVVLVPEPGDAERVRRAARACPSGAISLAD